MHVILFFSLWLSLFPSVCPLNVGRGLKRKAAPDDEYYAQRRKDFKGHLHRWEAAATQALNPYGYAGCFDVSLNTLWEKVSDLPLKVPVPYYTELADRGPDAQERQSVGLSRICQSYGAAMKEIQKPVWKEMIDKRLYDRVIVEVQAIQPSFDYLNAGQKKAEGSSSLSGLSYAQNANTEAIKSAKDVEQHAKKVYDWLIVQSVLRDFIHHTAGGGALYSGAVNEKILRAFIKAGPISQEQFCLIAQTRHAPPTIDIEPDGAIRSSFK